MGPNTTGIKEGWYYHQLTNGVFDLEMRLFPEEDRENKIILLNQLAK